MYMYNHGDVLDCLQEEDVAFPDRLKFIADHCGLEDLEAAEHELKPGISL